MNLLDYACNVTSQCGEDGILAEVFRRIPATGPRWCVDVGAGDGVTFSNTRQLILAGWRSVQIEADRAKWEKLQELYAELAEPVVKCLWHPVGWQCESKLDVLLNRLSWPQPGLNFDFLSLDVDGNELAIWSAVRQYRPKVVCVEFNPTWPPWVARTQAADPAANRGASLAATVRCGKDKRYELVCATAWNAIFATAELYPLFDLDPVAPNDHRILGSYHPELWTYEAWDYDGTAHRGGLQRSMWPARDGRYAGALECRQEQPWHGLASGMDQTGQPGEV